MNLYDARRPDVRAASVRLLFRQLPVALADRARALLERQLATAQALSEAAQLSRKHTRAVQALKTTPPSSPVYVDTPA